MDVRRLKRLVKALREEGVTRYAYEDGKEKVALDIGGGPAREGAAPRRRQVDARQPQDVESILRDRFAPVPSPRRAS